jgi:mandelamide amidase
MLTQFLADFDTGVTFDELMAQVSPDIQTVFSQFVLPGSEFSPTMEDFTAARDQHLPALQKTLADYYHDNNLAATIFPVAQITAPLIGQNPEMILNGQTVSFGDVISRNISPGSTGSLPGIVVPAGLNRDGLPVCLELDGPAGSDRSLLGIGVAIESVLGQLPPPRI